MDTNTSSGVPVLQGVEYLTSQLEAVFSTVSDGLLLLDEQGRVQRLNPQAALLLARAADELVEGEPEALFAGAVTAAGGKLVPDQAPHRQALAGATVRGQVLSFERAGGQPRILSVSAVPVRAPGAAQASGVLVALTDITPMRALDALREQHDTVLRSVSHDLRNPLAVVVGQSDLLRRLLDSPLLADQASRSIDAIRRSARRISTMLDELLQVARFEGGQLRPMLTPVELPAFFEELLSSNALLLPPERVRLELQTPLPPVLVDESFLERILLNLLGNALKYSPPNAPVLLEARCLERGVRLQVVDRGAGIKAEEQEHLFERFWRSPSHRGVEGLGLGLYITRRLAQAMGAGEVSVQSEPGEGSRFWFDLPLAP